MNFNRSKFTPALAALALAGLVSTATAVPVAGEGQLIGEPNRDVVRNPYASLMQELGGGSNSLITFSTEGKTSASALAPGSSSGFGSSPAGFGGGGGGGFFGGGGGGGGGSTGLSSGTSGTGGTGSSGSDTGSRQPQAIVIQQVPDSGSTILLLSSGVLMLGLIRRRFSA